MEEIDNVIYLFRMPQPKIVPISDRRYTLVEDYHVNVVTSDSRRCMIHIDAGFENDGASVPRFLWWFLRPDGLHRGAALVHDFLYDKGGMLDDHEFMEWHQCEDSWVHKPEFFRKSSADLIFRDMMINSGINKSRAEIAYQMVKIFGKGNYD